MAAVPAKLMFTILSLAGGTAPPSPVKVMPTPAAWPAAIRHPAPADGQQMCGDTGHARRPAWLITEQLPPRSPSEAHPPLLHQFISQYENAGAMPARVVVWRIDREKVNR
jgi:hypothetical protein